MKRKSIYSGSPSFAPNPDLTAIGKYALLLVTSDGENLRDMGSAILIGQPMAITAGHIVDACERAYGPLRSGGTASFNMMAIKPADECGSVAFNVRKIFRSAHSDIALLILQGDRGWLPSIYPRLNFEPPRVGDKVFSFGYAGRVEAGQNDETNIYLNPYTSTGEVLEVFPNGRDSVVAPFPCFSTNARFDDCMSGGPVFNVNGSLSGITCSNLPPFEDAEQHYSMVTSLWPLAALQLDLPWHQCPDPQVEVKPYLLYERLVEANPPPLGISRLRLESGQVRYFNGSLGEGDEDAG